MSSVISNLLEPFSYLIYAIAVCLQHKINKSIKIKVLIVYYILATLLMTYASWSVINGSHTAESNNNWAYNILYFLSIFFLSFYMYKTFTSIKSKTVTLLLLVINIMNFFLNDLLFKQKLIDSFVSSISVLSLILLIFLFFQQLLQNVNEDNILHDFDFWLISGYLLYYFGSFFIIMSWSHLSARVTGEPTDEQGAQFNILWGVHNILLFFSAFITLIGNLWIRRYQKKLH